MFRLPNNFVNCHKELPPSQDADPSEAKKSGNLFRHFVRFLSGAQHPLARFLLKEGL